MRGKYVYKKISNFNHNLHLYWYNQYSQTHPFSRKKILLLLAYTWTNIIFDSLMGVQVTKVSRYTIYWKIYLVTMGMISITHQNWKHRNTDNIQRSLVFSFFDHFLEKVSSPTNSDFVPNVTPSLTLYYTPFNSLFRKKNKMTMLKIRKEFLSVRWWTCYGLTQNLLSRRYHGLQT